MRLLLLVAAVALAPACAATENPHAVSPAADRPVAARPPAVAHESRPAASQVDPERPLQLVLPSGTTLPVDVATTDPRGRLALPDDVDRAGWWRGSARLGHRFGAIVLAAHVDSFDEGIGPIAELLSATPGDRLLLRSRTLARTYVVTSAELVPRSALGGLAPLMSFTGKPRLVVITCGGPYDAAQGGYQDNLVVVAE